MAVTSSDFDVEGARSFPPGWYLDPWGVAPWRWWDGARWTPVIYGPYGEAWPQADIGQRPLAVKGPGIRGGGIAAVGAIIGVAGSLAVYVVYFIVSSTRSLPLNHPGLLLASEIPLWIGFVGATVIASKINGSGSLVRDFNLSWPNWRDLGSGAAGGVLGRLWPLFILFLVAVGTHRGFGPNSASAPRLLGESPTNASGWLILIVLTVVGAPLVEELYFRGLVQGAFSQRIGAIPSIFVTALIFSLVHLTSEGLAAPLALFPMALILGYLRHKTGRLAAGMIAHATFNASILLLFLVPAFR